MPITRPTKEDVAQLGTDLHLKLTSDEVSEFHSLMGGMFDAYDLIDAMPNPVPPVEFPRTPGARPSADQNKLGAWACRTEVNGAPEGKLSGKTIVLKDNVALAGVPMINGSTALEGSWAGGPVKSIKKGFKPAAVDTGLTDVSPHVLRHTAAVHMAEAGISIDEIAKYSGHSDPRITASTYARYSPENLRKAPVHWSSANGQVQ